MADVKKPNLEENLQKLEYDVGISPEASLCKCRQALGRRWCIYIFPVCAVVASLMLVSFAFRTPRPGISLGFSFLLLILAIFYCVVGSVVKCWLPRSEHEGCNTESDNYDKTNLSLVIVSSSEEQGDKV